MKETIKTVLFFVTLPNAIFYGHFETICLLPNLSIFLKRDEEPFKNIT